jgi:hypothetical protein
MSTCIVVQVQRDLRLEPHVWYTCIYEAIRTGYNDARSTRPNTIRQVTTITTGYGTIKYDCALITCVHT